MRLSEKKRLALVLSGGGIKAAAFHIGVCQALIQKGFKFLGGPGDPTPADESHPLTFRIYVGSSAGSVIASFLAGGFSLEAIIYAVTSGSLTQFSEPGLRSDVKLRPLSYRDIFSLNVPTSGASRLLSKVLKKKPVVTGGLEVLLKKGFRVNGLFTTKGLERYLREHVVPQNDFRRLRAELYVVATQLNHSRKVVFGPYSETTKTPDIKFANYAKISEAVAASASLPPFFAPFPITNERGKEIYFFDGEIRDTLSTHVAADHGADLVISSYSIQPYHFNEKMGSLHEFGIPAIFNQALYQVVQQKIERHIKHQQNTRAMIQAASGYLSQIGLAQEQIDKLIEILASRSNFNPNVDYIYIHPSPQDYEFFFYDHFSLNRDNLASMVRTGFKAAMNRLRSYNI